MNAAVRTSLAPRVPAEGASNARDYLAVNVNLKSALATTKNHSQSSCAIRTVEAEGETCSGARHFLPDYTAYEELLDIFKAFTAIPILLEPQSGYAFSLDDLRREIEGRGLSALLLSNPNNPTGKLIAGDELSNWVAIAREYRCTLMFDEFYSHYIWNGHSGFARRERREIC